MKKADKLITGISDLENVLDEWCNNADTEKSIELKTKYIEAKTEFCQMITANYKNAKALGYELYYLNDEDLKKLGG